MATIVGIVGGMGPAATVDLFDQIVRNTPARRDQEHLHILINNDTRIPDRTDAILHGGQDPLPFLVEAAQLLTKMGATLIAMPCNTAHFYWSVLQAQVDAPLLHMIRETATAIRQQHPAVKRVGVLATAGTLKVGLYQEALAAAELVAIVPGEQALAWSMEAIYAIKGSELSGAGSLLKRAGLALVEKGAEVVVLGCTEIPLALHQGDLPVPVVNPTEVLAKAVVRDALINLPT